MQMRITGSLQWPLTTSLEGTKFPTAQSIELSLTVIQTTKALSLRLQAGRLGGT